MRILRFAVTVYLIVPLLVAAEPELAANSQVKVGFIAPLTGPFAKWGESLRRGAEMAIEATGGRLSIDFQDDACESATAVTIAQRLFAIKEHQFIIGPGCDNCLKAILPLARQHQGAVFSTGLLNDEVFAHNDNVINFSTQISAEAQRLIRYLASSGVRRFAIVHGTNSFGEEFARQLEQAAASRNINSKSFATPLGTSDFRSLLPRVLSLDPQSIFIHQGEAETLAFLRQLRAVAPTVRIAGPYNLETESFASAPEADGLEYSYPLNSALGSPEKEEFDRRFRSKYGESAVPSASTYYVYDGFVFLDQALRHCSKPDPECVLRYFKSLGGVKGLSGDMVYQPDGSNVRPYGVKQLRKRQFIWLEQNK